jgi:hypothetical protein
MRSFLVLLAFSLPAAAQTPAPAPEKPAATPEKPAATQPATEPRRPLILRLDDPDGPKMSFGASEGERYRPADLPALGEGTRPIDPSWSPRSSPYPHSSENLQ